MIILLFGPPGCGKGTQAAVLAKRLQIPSISTGDMFRDEYAAGTELGKAACAILTAGGLVGDDIVNQMVVNRTSQPDCTGGFLLDGYPRTLPQARFLSALLNQRGLAAPLVVHLDVAEELLVTRLTARRQCPKCKAIYNLLSKPPKTDGICDADGATLITRDDDQESVIRRRQQAYRQQTGPVLDWYAGAAIHTIDASHSPIDVTAAIEHALLAAQ